MLMFRGPKRSVGSVDFSPDGTRLAAGDKDGVVWLFDLHTPRAVRFEAAGPCGLFTVRALFVPGGRQVVVGDERSRVAVWDAGSGGRVATLHGEESRYYGVRGLAFDGGRLLTADYDQDMAAFDAATWGRLPPVLRPGDVPRTPRGFALEPGGRRAALVSGELIDVRAGAVCGRWAEPGGHQSFAWCPGRPLIASVSYGPTVRVYDPDAQTRVAELTPPTLKHVNAAAFTPDGNTLITAGNDGVTRLYDCETWRERAAFDWKAGPLGCVAVSPDGTQAAAGGGNSQRGKVVVWDLE